MKNLILMLPLAIAALGFSSCSTFGVYEGTGNQGPDGPTYSRARNQIPSPPAEGAPAPGTESRTEAARKRATVQGATGSPHVGLIPTMKPIVP